MYQVTETESTLGHEGGRIIASIEAMVESSSLT